MNPIDMTGEQLGYWTVIERAANDGHGNTCWRCRCKCGAEKVVVGTVLRDGRSQSCGCLKRETTVERSTKHGHATAGVISPTYHSWASMVARCTNPNNKRNARYMARGITVCDRWLVFANFLSDMGEKPGGTSLGRVDNNKGYCPENCRWETTVQQARNRVNNRILEFNGESHTVTEWAIHLGVPVQRPYNRLHLGWPTERVLTP